MRGTNQYKEEPKRKAINTGNKKDREKLYTGLTNEPDPNLKISIIVIKKAIKSTQTNKG